MTEEITQGWSLPLPPEFALDLQDAEVTPHGLVSQYIITRLREIIEKDRITHDQSYREAHSKSSINSRVITEDFTPCMFGHIYRRLIYYIIECRQHHPYLRIWISKVDWKSAYKRKYLNSRVASKSISQAFINGYSFLCTALCLTCYGKTLYKQIEMHIGVSHRSFQ